MKNKNHLLKLSNTNRLILTLSKIVGRRAIKQIKDEKKKNVRALLRLSFCHYKLAASIQDKRQWRQIVSRAYYCCYIASKAIRLATDGDYSEEVKDHEKIAYLPDDFPEKNERSNFLNTFRGDRNICDYDHTATLKDLEYSVTYYLEKSQTFLKDSKSFLKKRGEI